MLITNALDKNVKKGIYAIISGVLLLLFGSRYIAERYIDLIISAVDYGILDVATARSLAGILPFLIVFSAILVIAGGLIYIKKGRKFYAGLLIGLGSGASVFNLILTSILTGPLVKLYLIKNEVVKVMSIGTSYALVLLALLFAYMALLSDFSGFTLAFLSGFFINISGSMIEYTIIMRFLGHVGVVNKGNIYAVVIGFIITSGLLLFLTALLYGYEKYTIGVIVSILNFILYLPLYFLMMSAVMIPINIIRVILASIGLFFTVITIIYGMFKMAKKKTEELMGKTKGTMKKITNKLKKPFLK